MLFENWILSVTVVLVAIFPKKCLVVPGTESGSLCLDLKLACYLKLLNSYFQSLEALGQLVEKLKLKSR